MSQAESLNKMDFIKTIDDNRDLQIKTLQELVAIKSVAGDPVTTTDGEVLPFGRGVQDAFAYTMKKAEEFGFITKNVNNYGGHADFGDGDEIVGIMGHLDVVPEGDGWSFDPYGGEADEEYVYGRGTTDDKGPTLAVLFAMKALKDAGYVPAKKIRLILGLDEEVNSAGMKYYLEHETPPTFGFTPDADFPVLNGEKGIMSFTLAKKLSRSPSQGLLLSSFSSGTAINVVPNKARAVVRSEDPEVYDSIKDRAAGFRAETGHKLYVKGVGKSLELLAEGISAHGSTPEKGLNAISIMMEFLGRLSFANEDVNDFIDFYNKYIGFCLDGSAIGCDFEDSQSGELTWNTGLAAYDKQAISVTINVRYPVTDCAENVYESIAGTAAKYDVGIIKQGDSRPIYMDPDSPMIKTFLDVYRDNTGDMESQPKVIGGGTYARCAENIFAFGPEFPGDPDLMHQADERWTIERYMTATKIYADALYRMTQENFNIIGENENNE